MTQTVSRVFLNKTVYAAALERIEWVFREFPEVVVTFSGGKDSTVTLHMALIVAEKLNRLPLKTIFIDQEAEWRSVIDYVRETFSDPRIDPWWFQMPLRIFNATSSTEPWLHCWRAGDEWMREREPASITENVYGTDRFKGLFSAIIKHHWPKTPCATLAGVRCEESPARTKGLTNACTYKHAPWGSQLNKSRGHYTFYPLYDWSYRDIWKAIHDNGWPYTKIYDYMYQYGVQVRDMRVSNLHHETAVHSLFHLQEIEGATWEALTRRLSGINGARHMDKRQMFQVRELPRMFADWREYRDHLLANLVSDEDQRQQFSRAFASQERRFDGMADPDIMFKAHVKSILANDFTGTKLNNFETTPPAQGFKKWKSGRANRKTCMDWVPVHVDA